MQFGKPMKNADYGDNVETETGSKIPIWRQLVKQKFYKAVQHVAKMAPAWRRHTVDGGGAPFRHDPRRRRRQQNVGDGGTNVTQITTWLSIT